MHFPFLWKDRPSKCIRKKIYYSKLTNHSIYLNRSGLGNDRRTVVENSLSYIGIIKIVKIVVNLECVILEEDVLRQEEVSIKFISEHAHFFSFRLTNCCACRLKKSYCMNQRRRPCLLSLTTYQMQVGKLIVFGLLGIFKFSNVFNKNNLL